MSIRRIIRDRLLTPEEAAKYQQVRDQVAKEMPDLMQEHQQRMRDQDSIGQLFLELKSARETAQLSLGDIAQLTGMDRSALSKLETGQRPNPTVETLIRYAQAVGKKLSWTLEDLVPTPNLTVTMPPLESPSDPFVHPPHTTDSSQ